MRKIKRLEELVVFSNKYGTLYNDLVQGSDNKKGNYLRWKWADDGVIIVPVWNDKFALVRMYRYPPDVYSLEFPGGGVAKGESLEIAARRELKEEVGLIASEIAFVGNIYPDTGLLQKSVNVFVAFVEDSSSYNRESLQEPFEAISNKIYWMATDEFKSALLKGSVKSGTTIASAFLYLQKYKY